MEITETETETVEVRDNEILSNRWAINTNTRIRKKTKTTGFDKGA